MIDFASRAHNHNYRFDPIIRSWLDTDFYKLLMLQFIWMLFKDVPVTFSLINRTRSVRIAECVDITALRSQLDYVKSLRWTENELIWLAGNKFYGRRDIFRPEFIEFLRNDFRLSDYHLDTRDGQYVLTFSGPWAETTMWEIYALAIVNELRTRAGLEKMDEFELDILYAQAKIKLWNKIKRLRDYPDMRIAEFGTRRRHSFLWQEWVTLALANELGSIYTGTSNAYLAFKHGLPAIGTNAHELPMVMACLAETAEQLKVSQYAILEMWKQVYGGALLVFLPDTFGTAQFLKDAPEGVVDWTGSRIDSKDPFLGGEEMIRFYAERGRDPKSKLCLFSDGLGDELMIRLHLAFRGRVRDAFGWGTMATNDFIDCQPRGSDDLKAISLVCKVSEVNGRPAVKLSDNYEKATGPANEVARYRDVFGVEGVANAPVIV